MGSADEDPGARALRDQIRYYRRRAHEYDRTAKPTGDPLAEQGNELRAALRAFAPSGRVLEIACGTGLYTEELLPFAGEITSLDASPEMLRLARDRIASAKVRFVEADIFSWEPDTPYDVVFFSFWLSHVPPGHLERFWRIVDACLKPDGRVFFMDEGVHFRWGEDFIDEAAGWVRRSLRDGSRHRAVKVLWDPEDLRARLRELGWRFEVGRTEAFYWGHGQRAEIAR